MKKGKFEQQGRKHTVLGSKSMALLLALVLLIGAIAGGTLAWLTAKSDKVTNTFTTSNIEVTLTETKNDFKMVPGWTIDKDPKVTVKAGSEDCYLFVKVEESGEVTVGTGEDAATYKFDDFIAYAIDNGWTAGTGESGDGIPTNVYYRKVENVTTDMDFGILAAGKTSDDVTISWDANQVATKPSVTEQMMEAMEAVETATNKPTLSFTAYAVQLWKSNKPVRADGQSEEDYETAVEVAQFTPAEAWAQASKS